MVGGGLPVGDVAGPADGLPRRVDRRHPLEVGTARPDQPAERGRVGGQHPRGRHVVGGLAGLHQVAVLAPERRQLLVVEVAVVAGQPDRDAADRDGAAGPGAEPVAEVLRQPHAAAADRAGQPGDVVDRAGPVRQPGARLLHDLASGADRVEVRGQHGQHRRGEAGAGHRGRDPPVEVRQPVGVVVPLDRRGAGAGALLPEQPLQRRRRRRGQEQRRRGGRAGQDRGRGDDREQDGRLAEREQRRPPPRGQQQHAAGRPRPCRHSGVGRRGWRRRWRRTRPHLRPGQPVEDAIPRRPRGAAGVGGRHGVTVGRIGRGPSGS